MTSAITVEVQRLPHAEGLALPAYQSAHAAGLDLLAAVPEDTPLTMQPGQRALVPTGLMIAVPPGHEAQVRTWTVLRSPPITPDAGDTSLATIQSQPLRFSFEVAFSIRFCVSAAKPITN